MQHRFRHKNVEQLQELEYGFAADSRQWAIHGAIVALDGDLIWQKTGKHVQNPNSYYRSRKRKFAILLLAMCEANRRFLWFDTSCTPTKQDLLVWHSTELGYEISSGQRLRQFLIPGENVFTTTRETITTGEDSAFNFEQRSLKINVECAFGALIRRCGVLWSPLETDIRKRTAVIGCCIRLHNFCINARLELTDELRAENGLVEVMPGIKVLAPPVYSYGIPINQMTRYCRCHTCTGPGKVFGNPQSFQAT